MSMRKTLTGYQVIKHTRTSDDLGRFYPVRRRYTKATRIEADREARAGAMDEASCWADRHAADFGEGRASVYRATLKMTGRPLHDRQGGA